ncbi:DMT family transporter [Romboutsia ilealis]|uniref:DMT family transporter n=1 Tax=Romboutsia ilealis TaxID=1115758 RepID=UPI0025733294|nr:DMT family transporter [Romboutsia ilealis]
MENIFAIIFATLAGVSTSLEAFINGELGKNTTALVATFISLVVGTIFFFINICLTGNLKTLLSFNDINPKLLLGGVLGGLVIYFTVKSVPNLGVSKTLTLIVVSQMIVGFFIDLHIYKETMHLYNYIGAILLFVGTFFILN